MNQAALHILEPAGRGDERTDALGWPAWLRAHLDPAWRLGEWDGQLWLFTGDLAGDKTAAWRCRTPGCESATRYHHGRCTGCRRACTGLGLCWKEFDAARPGHPTRPTPGSGHCAVPGCASEPCLHRLCARHAHVWRAAGGGPVEAFAARAVPLERQPDCLVAGCAREGSGRSGLCRPHTGRLRRYGPGAQTAGQVTAWIAAQAPVLGGHQFSLAGLAELPRVELLYALQRRDLAPPPLDPMQVRVLADRLGGVASLRGADPETVCESGGLQYNSAARSLFRDLRKHLDRGWAAYTGDDPFAGDVWQVALLDLQPNASRHWPATQGVIDFRPIEPAWLRRIVKDWAQSTRPNLQRLREALRACLAASHTLTAAGHTDPAMLGAGDFTRIIDAIADQRREDGGLYSAAHRNLLLYQFCQVVEHGRGAGLMACIPDPFRPAGRHRVHDSPNEDEIGKALPETVIAQLDAHLQLLGPAGHAGSITAADLQQMYRSIYQILRDTGRRPGEVVSLHIDCIEIIDGQHNLIYDNHKAGRMRRRLPITTATAQIVTTWRQHRAQLTFPPAQRGWLFPTPMLRARQSTGHITPSCVDKAFKAWTGRIGVIDSELLGPDGHPVPYEHSLIFPYALRHSYAQRHADAGVPVDVLRELMDHAAVATTMGYYTVGLERKRQAIAAVGALAMNAAGKPAPFTSPTAYQRSSVSVPFGNCTEPSNVTAGGGACPIRFQCAGCGFYRPDPSYLPALEQHIAALRTDRETARAIGAAGYVLASLTAEIDAFTLVVDKMRGRMAELDDEQRADLERAGQLLRRARAGQRLPLTVTTTPPPWPDEHHHR